MLSVLLLCMPENIEHGKLLYHLTDLDNLESIIINGLLPRKMCKNFKFSDVADPDIISFREEHELDEYVPFHFFPQNPFDGRVQLDNPDHEFVFICLQRDNAAFNNFKIIPQHPCSMDPFKMYDYEEGMGIIDWDTMNSRQFKKTDPNSDYCANVCMAECIFNGAIPAQHFQSIRVQNDITAEVVGKMLNNHGVNNTPPYVNVQPSWFI